jgi:hypothetical protein
MDEPQNPWGPQESWTFPSAPAEPPPHPEEGWRRTLRRRLMVLLGVGCLAFAGTTWLLVRDEASLGLSRLASRPSSVVRAQLAALNRGDLRSAYDLFSAKYRGQVSFEAFHQLVVTHRSMFRTRQVHIGRDTESGERALLETHLVTEGGQRYMARYTLVRAEGRWWVDDLHWGSEPEEGRKSRA